MKETAAIRLEDVGVSFSTGRRRTEAIRSLSGEVAPGAFVSIVGPSGCGKTTLLDLLAGLAKPTNGTVFVNGARVDGPRTDTAIVFQDDSTLHWRTVIDNVAFGLEARGVPKADRTRRAQQIISLLRLEGFEKHRPSELSGGMRQRVAIGRAFALNPAILLMDEPFGALDQLTRRSVADELINLWSQDAGPRKTVIFITHDTSEAVLLSDQVWVLSPRPCEIVSRVEVALPRPRTKELSTTPEFQSIVREIDAALELEREA